MSDYHFPELQSSLKKYENYKADTPASTIQRIEAGLKRLKGCDFEYVETNHHDLLLPDIGIHTGDVVLKDRSFSTSGKGNTRDLCKASAMAEFAERLSAGCFRNIVPLLNTYKRKQKDFLLEAKKNIDTTFSDDYFFTTGYLEQANAEMQDKINNFEQPWKPIYSLTNDRYVNYPFLWHWSVCLTNGYASGNTIEEALVHAICEVLEREARFRVLSGEKYTAVELSSLPQGVCEWIAQFETKGYKIAVFDLSIHGVPVMGVNFRDQMSCSADPVAEKWHRDILMIGAHTDPEVAIARCFTEFYQIFSPIGTFSKIMDNYDEILNFIGKDDKIYFPFYSNSSRMDRKIKTNGTPAKSYTDVPNIFAKDYLTEIESITRSLKKADIEIFIEDCTHQVIGFPVVRVVIPKFRLNYLESPELSLTVVDSVQNIVSGRLKFYSGLQSPMLRNYYGHAPLFSSIVSGEWKDNPTKLNVITEALIYSLRLETVPGHTHSTIWGAGPTVMILIKLYIYSGQYDKAFIFAKNLSREMPYDNEEFWSLYAYLAHRIGVKRVDVEQQEKIALYDQDELTRKIDADCSHFTDATGFAGHCNFNCKQCVSSIACPFKTLGM